MVFGICGKNSNLPMFGEIEEIAAESMNYDSNSDGKNSFGSSLGTLFGGFSVGDNTSGLTRVSTEGERSDAVEAGAMPSGAKIYLDFCVDVTTENGYVINDNNIPDTLEKRQACIVNGFSEREDPNAMRPASLRSPVWIEGSRILSSGIVIDAENETETASAGPLNLIFNKKKGVWEQPISFPCYGEVVEERADFAGHYSVKVVGSTEIEQDDEQDYPDTYKCPTSLVNDGRDQIHDVYNLRSSEEGGLSSGDPVTIFYDSRNDKYTCSMGGGNIFLYSYASGETDVCGDGKFDSAYISKVNADGTLSAEQEAILIPNISNFIYQKYIVT